MTLSACDNFLVRADNTNWSSHQSKTKTNKTGGAYPPDTNPGVSNIPINKGDKFPVVPPLPVSSKYAPDGSDEWDGELEAVDKDKDGYFTGRSLHAEKSPSPRERLTLAQLSDRSGIADLVSTPVLFVVLLYSNALPNHPPPGVNEVVEQAAKRRHVQGRNWESCCFRQHGAPAPASTVGHSQLVIVAFVSAPITIANATMMLSQDCTCSKTGAGETNRLGVRRETRA